MELNLQWLTDTMVGEFTLTMLVSMIPVVELRGGIPFGVTLGLPVWAAFIAAVIGNLIPVPFIIVYIRRIFQWMRKRIPKLNRLVDALERKAHLKGQRVTKYKYLGLMLFVAIPLPGTGAWTGSLAAAFLDMPLHKALPSVILGVIIAGMAISILSYGIVSLF
ncbi:MAG: small multi-drug export protein [Oscillospiraceae bacterium]|nr:small multi-drug export protein [Oscillospiraceae bacterium]